MRKGILCALLLCVCLAGIILAVVPKMNGQSDVMSERGTLYGFETNSGCGYIDENGNIVVEAKYADVSDFYGGYGCITVTKPYLDMEQRKYIDVEETGLYVDSTGRLIDVGEYVDGAKPYPRFFDISYHNSYLYYEVLDDYLPIYVGDKGAGFFDARNNRIAIEPKWIDFSLFSEGICLAFNKEGFCTIDRNGKICGKFTNCYVVDRNNKCIDGVMLVGSTINPRQFSLINIYAEDIPIPSGFTLTGEKYYSRHMPTQCLYVVTDSEYAGMDEYKWMDINYGAINAKGQMVLPCVYDEIYAMPYSAVLLVKHNGVYGLVNYNGKSLSEPLWNDISQLSNGLFIVKSEDGLFGLLDKDGKTLSEPQWNEISLLNNGLYAARINHRNGGKTFGLLDENGKPLEGSVYSYRDNLDLADEHGYFVSGFSLSNITEGFFEGLACVFNGYEYFYIDENGAPIMGDDVRFNIRGKFCDGLAKTEQGYIDKSGAVVIPMPDNANKLSYFSEGYSAVGSRRWVNEKNHSDRIGFINKNGEFILPIHGDEKSIAVIDARPFRNGLAAIKDTNEKWGFINSSGDVVIPCTWDGVINSFEKRVAIVQKYEVKIVLDFITGDVVEKEILQSYYILQTGEVLGKVRGKTMYENSEDAEYI